MINSSATNAGVNQSVAPGAAALGVLAAVVAGPVLAADASNGKRVVRSVPRRYR